VSWQPGRERIGELLVAGELDRVTPNDVLARALIDDAGRHLQTAAAGISTGDLSGAYQLAYDAMRKSAAALLAVQGLRATSRGGHIAIQEAITAQFAGSVRAFKAFGRIRRARNRFEYPDADTAGPTREDVDDAVHSATAARDASTILDRDLLRP
jgi:uncharacterized protein (UPF0332 family)